MPGGTLEPAGFTVAEAATGAEAADAARTIRPGLVPLDIQLPDSDGFEVARRLAAAPAGDPAPVVVLTSTQVARDYGGRTAASPAAGFLPKDQLPGAALQRFLARDALNRRLPAALIAGAIAAVVGLVAAGPVPSDYRLSSGCDIVINLDALRWWIRRLHRRCHRATPFIHVWSRGPPSDLHDR